MHAQGLHSISFFLVQIWGAGYRIPTSVDLMECKGELDQEQFEK